MSNIEVLVTDNGLQTIDGRGILPGSILVVKGSEIPAAWTGVCEKAGSISDKKLQVATPAKKAEKSKESE